MAPCLREVQIDTGTLLLNQCLFLLLVFWLDFVYSFPAKIWFTLETLKLKAQVTLLPVGMKKKSVCGCTHNPSPNGAEFTQEAFHIEFALQGALGLGSPGAAVPSRACAPEAPTKFFHLSCQPCEIFTLSSRGLQRSPSGKPGTAKEQQDGGLPRELAKLLFPTAAWPHALKAQAMGRVPLLRAGEATAEADCRIGIARRGEESSAPLSGNTEKPPSLGGSRAADGWAATLSSQGVYHFSDCSGRWYPCWRGAPPLTCSRLLYALIFLQLLLKIAGNLSCSLADTLVDCLPLFLPFDTDVLGHVLPCAPDFLLYM